MDQNALALCKTRVVRLLYPTADGSLPLRLLLQRYRQAHHADCPLSFLTEHMDDVIQVRFLSHQLQSVASKKLRVMKKEAPRTAGCAALADVVPSSAVRYSFSLPSNQRPTRERSAEDGAQPRP